MHKHRSNRLISVVLPTLLVGAVLLALFGCGRPAPPEPPQQVVATKGTHVDRVIVTWEPAVDATYYGVQRSEAENGPWEVVGETGVEEFVDHDVVPGLSMWYVVVACNAAGCSAPSLPAQGHATDEEMPSPPPPPDL